MSLLPIYLLVFISGASALLYEVVWHKYLCILLGAQARATAIILAIYLGGLSAGYFYFGRKSIQDAKRLLKLYLSIEVALAVWAFLFSPLFLKVLVFRHLKLRPAEFRLLAPYEVLLARY
jgi:spermidine synthase